MVAQNLYSTRKHKILFPLNCRASLVHSPSMQAYVVVDMFMAMVYGIELIGFGLRLM
jgi:hypothetical protein